jgi:hypothetical protein
MPIHPLLLSADSAFAFAFAFAFALAGCLAAAVLCCAVLCCAVLLYGTCPPNESGTDRQQPTHTHPSLVLPSPPVLRVVCVVLHVNVCGGVI